MEHENQSAIARLVKAHGGQAALAKKQGMPAYQEIQRWVYRGWASPKYIFPLEQHLPEGMTLRDLYDDVARHEKASGSASDDSRDSAHGGLDEVGV